MSNHAHRRRRGDKTNGIRDIVESPGRLAAALTENLRRGFIEVAGVNDDGDVQFRVTEAGKRYLNGGEVERP